MINGKKKGNRGENLFSEFLRDNGFKAYRDSASGASTHKSDIVNGMDYSMEVKTCKKINLKKCFYQVTRDSALARNAPLLAVHFDGMKEKEWIICLHSNDWIELEKATRLADKPEISSAYTDPNTNRELSYALNQLKTSLSKVNKLLNE